MRRVSQRPALLVLTALALATPACSSCGASSQGPAEAAPPAVVEAPVPAPAGLLAEVRVRAPDALWAKIQNGVSGAVALMPPTAGELASAAAGLDRRVASLVDGKATAYGALADAASGDAPAWALALPLKEARADAAAFAPDAAPPREVAGMRLLPTTDRASSVVAALASRWLVLASSEDDLARLGPYVTRTLPVEPSEAGGPSPSDDVVVDVPQAALAGSVSRRLAAAWDGERAWLTARDDEERAKHGGRAPDFGDPRPIVEAADAAVKRRLSLLTAALHARLTVEAGDDELHAELSVTPGADPATVALLGRMHPGPTKPLADAPGDAVVAVLARDDAASRGEDSAALEATVDHAFGARLHDEDVRAIHAALEDWSRAHGDWWMATLGWGASDAARGVWLTTPAEGDGSTRAVRELLDLSHRGPARDLLVGSLHLAPAAFSTVDVPAVGRASVATFAPSSPRGPVGAPALGFAWAVHDGLVQVAAGPSPGALLAAGAAPSSRVGDDARAARALEALHGDATFAVFARPLLFDAARFGPEAARAPAVFAWGRKDGGPWARVELADVVLRELLHLKAGF